MTPLLIPTRNRPTSLSNVLRYLVRFYPATHVIIADGSADFYKNLNRRNIDALEGRLAIDYRPYPPDLPFFDRLLHVLRGENCELVIMGSDDDYPMMDTLGECELFLLNNPDFSLAVGMVPGLNLNSPNELNTHLFSLARPILGDTPLKRAGQYAAWPFQTTYAVTRREVLIERYERARKQFLVSFFDFALGIQDCIHGKIKALPKIGFICTRNYNHSYLRQESDLSFLRRAEQVLQYLDQFRSDLMQYAGLDEEGAQKASERLVKQRIRELVGRPAPTQEGFENSRMFLNPTVQKQFAIFNGLFEKGTRVRAEYEERLVFILSAIKANAQSEDNRGEKKKNETLDGLAAETLAAFASSQER